MSEERFSSSFFSACSTIYDEPTSPEYGPSRANKKYLKPKVEAQNPSSLWSQSHPRGTSAPKIRQCASRREESNSAKTTFRDAERSSKLSAKYLNNLLQKEVDEIAWEVTTDKSTFDLYLQKSPLKSDWLVQILKIVTKICKSEYEGIRSILLEKLCKSPFLDNLSNYLGQMTEETDPQVIEELPKLDLCLFFSSLLDDWPILAVEKDLQTLVKDMKKALNNSSFILGRQIDRKIPSELQKFIDKIDAHRKIQERTPAKKMDKKTYSGPSGDFRHLSLYPTTKDLLGTEDVSIKPKIEGPYANVEHYLDVQFRLLRADFMVSLRSGIKKLSEFKLESESRENYKFDKIRVYWETRLESWKQNTSSTKEVGIRLNFDPHGRFSRTCDWVQNKRFMYGSLIFLTTNDFSTFTCATVIERDVATLKEGRVLVALVEENPNFHREFANSFTMVESELFFVPYFHSLQVLKNLDEQSFPMTDYIVRVHSMTKRPLYPDKESYRPVDDGCYTRDVDATFWDLVWDDDEKEYRHVPFQPAVNNSLQLDKYQKEAYEAGLKRDFCIIQGPPGTGKTFLGLKLVESILRKCHANKKKLPILIVSLTNHALDQSLERMLRFTNKIVRAGGQSQNKNLTSRNLESLRRVFFHLRLRKNFPKLAPEIANLGQGIENMKNMKKDIETPVGILSTCRLKLLVNSNFLPVVENDEILLEWLLEDKECKAHLEHYFVYFMYLFENEKPKPIKVAKGDENTFDLKSICEVKCLKSYSITLNELEEKLQSTRKQFNALIEDEDLLLDRGRYDSNDIYFEKNYLSNQIQLLTRRCNTLKANLKPCVEYPEAKVVTAVHQDPYKLLSKSRWMMYRSWLAKVQTKLQLELSELESRHQVIANRQKQYQMLQDLHIMKQADVIGMTTTGAARLNKLLGLLKPAIGDHKQLRPHPTRYEDEGGKLCNIVHKSLFERMVNNGMHCPMLKVQYRMRPEISALISPLIYPDLENHKSVTLLKRVKGVKKNLFFLDHNMPETMTFDHASKENFHEAEFVVKLAKYFVQQGYKPDSIQLLTFYTRQMIQIKNLMKRDDYLKDVQCVVVDKYQGEENCIVILSLVRSNEDGDIGFLSIENRVCVALSRAKNGFFMIGNMKCLAKAPLWKELKTILEKTGAIGTELPLYCDRHSKITLVSNAEDFGSISDGGCDSVCNLPMECDHICKKKCHPFLGNHKSINCEELCARLCPRNHACTKLCKEECGKCVELVEKRLPCKHIVRVQCHTFENSCLCTEIVEDVLLSCEHRVGRKCHENIEEVSCTKLCLKTLSCGHACTRPCHKDDPDHLEYKCKESCSQTCPQCELKCKKECWEECHPCTNKVEKVISTCGHEIYIDCSVTPDRKLCQQDCKSMAPCGHKCQLKCGQVCNSRGCKEWVTSKAKKPLCVHEKLYVLCGEKNEVSQKARESFLANCQEPCGTVLECGHKCSGTCGQCLQGRLHRTCREMCRKTIICGHKCKSSCQKLCSCNEPCSFQCSHSKCTERCGIPCSTCKEPCEWECKHTKCTRKCGDICNRQPCKESCELKLPCGHDCIGFCGEPCPPQCRICNPEITEVKFGFENEPDARFVLMVDCGHVIESRAADIHFAATFHDGKIALKGCPRCKMPITKTLRYMNFVKRTYRQIAAVKAKNFEDVRFFDLKKIFLDRWTFTSQSAIPPALSKFCRICIKNLPDDSPKHFIFSSEMRTNYIYFFQLCQTLISCVLKLKTAPKRDEISENHVLPYLNRLIDSSHITFNVNRQLMMDLERELQRYHLMIDYQCIYVNSLIRFEQRDKEIPEICAKIKQILFGFAKFTRQDENKIKKLFKKLRTRPRKRSHVKKEVPRIFDDLRAGSWFQCPYGHYYCVNPVKNCRNCPECVKKGILAPSQSGRRTWKPRFRFLSLKKSRNLHRHRNRNP